MTTTASPSLSQALGRAAKVMRLLEQAGMTDDDFQRIINDNALRHQFVEAWRAIKVSPVAKIAVPETPNEDQLERLFRSLCGMAYQWDKTAAVRRTAFERLLNRYNVPGLFRRLVESCVEERDAGVLVLRYGLTTGVPMTQAEVGSVYRISTSRVGALEHRAFGQLSFPLSRQLEEFLQLYVEGLLENGQHSVDELDKDGELNLSMWLKGYDAYTVEQVTSLTEEDVLGIMQGHQNSVNWLKKQLANHGLKLKDA